ncbi:MAG: CRISPR-associated endonuclease Cas2 [Candidatus Taylorbacteria bacterium]|nr:CRISPR-associated endonuclease Cas2 [Candidatus Taylorbacteria bacterium]
MGKLEQEVKIRTRNTKIKRAILTALVVTVAGSLNPTAMVSVVLRALNIKRDKYRSARNTFYSARGRLLRQGLIEYNNGFFNVTDEGRRALQSIEFSNAKPSKPPRWDKKWRLLIFDVKEERKTQREKIRRTLIAIGFLRLQDSVWVYPYDCEDLVALLKADFKVGKELLYLIVDAIENDSWLKKEFNLPAN